jgi:hypothetical protein
LWALISDGIKACDSVQSTHAWHPNKCGVPNIGMQSQIRITNYSQ